MVVIRTDSSFRIGTGHVMRCLVLANNLRDAGINVHFVCRDLEGNVSLKITESHHGMSLIPQDASEESEIQEILSLKPDWVVVDHYAIDKKWESKLKDNCKIFVIDDLADREHAADVLLDQNFHIQHGLYSGLVPAECCVYEGPQFTLLRKSVIQQPVAKQRNNTILCFFGGTDFTGESLKLANALNKVKPQANFKLVIGKKNVKFKELVNLNSEHFELLIDPPEWERLMAECLFYFGSGGTVTWERLFLGTPGVVVAVAENQYQIAKDLASAGLQIFLGNAAELDYFQVIPALVELAGNTSELQSLRERSVKSVRPFPLEILEMIFLKNKKGFHLKKASMAHAEFLFELRNDPSTKAMFKNPQPVKLDDHQDWLGAKLKDSASRLYIAYNDNEPIGQFRVDADTQTSVTVHPKYRGRGFGEKLIREGTKMFFLEKPATQQLKAEIKNENISSMKGFSAAGYVASEAKPGGDGYITLVCKGTGT